MERQVSFVKKLVDIKGVGYEEIVYSSPEEFVACIKDIKKKYGFGSIKVLVEGVPVSVSEVLSGSVDIMNVSNIVVEPYDYGGAI